MVQMSNDGAQEDTSKNQTQHEGLEFDPSDDQLAEKSHASNPVSVMKGKRSLRVVEHYQQSPTQSNS